MAEISADMREVWKRLAERRLRCVAVIEDRRIMRDSGMRSAMQGCKL